MTGASWKLVWLHRLLPPSPVQSSGQRLRGFPTVCGLGLNGLWKSRTEDRRRNGSSFKKLSTLHDNLRLTFIYISVRAKYLPYFRPYTKMQTLEVEL